MCVAHSSFKTGASDASVSGVGVRKHRSLVLGVSRLSKRRSVFIHWLSIGVLTCIDLTFLPFAFWMHVYTFAWAPSVHRVHRCILKW